jgi:hypothetical protein
MIVREDSLVASAIKQVQTLLERGTKWWCAIDEVLHRAVGWVISENMKGVRTLVYNSSRPGTSLEDVNNLDPL